MLKNCHFARGGFPVCVLKLLTSKFLYIVDIKWYQMVSNFDTNICKSPKKSQREFCFTHLCKVTAPLGYPSSYPVEGAETSSLTASGLLLCHIIHPSFWLSDQVSTLIFFFTFIISEFGLSRKPVLCKLPLRIWTIRLRATIWRH